MTIALRADNVGKRYRLGQTHAGSVREVVNRAWQRLRGRRDRLLPHQHNELHALSGDRVEGDGSFWALRDVSFEVQPGEVVGIIGRNGSGKSTLLKIFSQITAPTTGRVELHGRVASLLEVGTGFHPELSGRENVFLNGAILGMTKSEIRRKFDEIVAFAEIETFIDTPVKRYSSGMYVRLAFAIAAHLEPEILIVDEVLAVGDTAFQQKCLGKMEYVAKTGRTVLFVSHNMTAVAALCNKGIVLRDGRVEAIGETPRAIAAYHSDAQATSDGAFELLSHPVRHQMHRAIIQRVTLSNAQGESTSRFTPEEALIATIVLKQLSVLRDPRLAMAVEDCQGRRIYTVASYFKRTGMPAIHGDAIVRCTIPKLNLGTGRYFLSVSVGTTYEGLLDSLDCFGQIEIEWENNYLNGELYTPVYGPVLQDSHWEIVSPPTSR